MLKISVYTTKPRHMMKKSVKNPLTKKTIPINAIAFNSISVFYRGVWVCFDIGKLRTAQIL